MHDIDPVLVFSGLAGSEMIRAAQARGLQAAAEVFTDRAYDGSLAPRGTLGALHFDGVLCPALQADGVILRAPGARVG